MPIHVCKGPIASQGVFIENADPYGLIKCID